MFKRLLVTGGAGFIGSAFVRYLLKNEPGVETLVNLDLLTYAGNLKNLKEIENDERYVFAQGDILNSAFVEELIRKYKIEAIVHFAAESHVDRSIDNPLVFYRTNVEGTIRLLEVVRRFPKVHFHHVSTDEVYGSINEGEFSEKDPYRPNSPYAASKAASDHFVRAYAKTYDLMVTYSHSSNNYGPCQYAEKFIPRMIHSCINKTALRVYGTGKNVRDWLFVDDHVQGIWQILNGGKCGEAYNIGGRCEKKNIELLKELIHCFAKVKGQSAESYTSLITMVEDRPGHDFRYALNSEKIEKELGWQPTCSFEEGIEKTIRWYLQHV